MCTCFVNVQKADMTRLALSLSDDFPKASHGTAFILRSFDAYVCVVWLLLRCIVNWFPIDFFFSESRKRQNGARTKE